MFPSKRGTSFKERVVIPVRDIVRVKCNCAVISEKSEKQQIIENLTKFKRSDRKTTQRNRKKLPYSIVHYKLIEYEGRVERNFLQLVVKKLSRFAYDVITVTNLYNLLTKSV